MSDPSKPSDQILRNPSHGAARAMLYATGYTEDDFDKPALGVASVSLSRNPCNTHLPELAQRAATALAESGGVAHRFDTCGVSDAMAMGTPGMRYSLISREHIADAVEMVMGGQALDGLLGIGGCDKNLPGLLLGMLRVNRPSMLVFGGAIRTGRLADRQLDIIDAFESWGEMASGTLSQDTREELLRQACPGPGACAGMFTASSMAFAVEVMGFTLPGSASNLATSTDKIKEVERAGVLLTDLVRRNLCPRDLISRASLRNALAVTCALGGSTNVVLHLLAAAHTAGVPLTLDDVKAVSAQTPVLGDLRPTGRYTMEHIAEIGGSPAVLKRLLDDGLIDGTIPTITGLSLADNLEEATDLQAAQPVIRPLADPIQPTGHLRVLHGNLSPNGALAKVVPGTSVRFEGLARVFDSEEQALAALDDREVAPGSAMIIRYVGPRGAPGMPEMLRVSAGVAGAGLSGQIAIITDGRFSGGSRGTLVGHVTPEAYDGGPIALVRDGDRIIINSETGVLTLQVSAAELHERHSHWTLPKPHATTALLRRYQQSVADATLGCVT